MSAGAWRIAWRNLRRNRRRNVTTGLAIALGFAALVALASFANHVQNFLRVYTIYGTRTGHLVIYKKGGLEHFSQKPNQFSLTLDDQKKIKVALGQMNGVEFDGPMLTGTGLIGNGCRTLPFFASGLDPELERRLRHHPEVQRWSPEQAQQLKGRGLWEYPADVGAVALATGLARLLNKPKVLADFAEGQAPVVIVDCQAPTFRQQIAADANVQLVAGSWTGMMSALDGEVVAHFNSGLTETNNAAVITTIEQLQKLYDTDHVTSWSLWLKALGAETIKRRQLTELLAKAGVEADIYEWHDERISPFYTGTMQFLMVMVTFFTAVLAVVVVFSIFNAATMTVIERSQEIGMMRSLGYRRRQIRSLFLRESLSLATLAIAGGGLLAFVGVTWVNAANIWIHPPGVAGGMPLTLTASFSLTAKAATLVVVLAMLATWVAVHQVAKRNIAALLGGHSG